MGYSGPHIDEFEKEKRVLKEFLTSKRANFLKQTFFRQLFDSIWCSSLTFVNSNAADSSVGWSFSDAFCEVKTNSNFVSFLSCFEKGTKILGDYIVEKQLPASKEDTTILYRLVNFFVNEADMKVILKYVPKSDDETAFCLVLANHLLSRLAFHQEYMIDSRYQSKKDGKCPCGCGADVNMFGNTSIGDEDVWHGRLDVVLPDGACLIRAGRKPVSVTEVKRDRSLEDSTICQLISQCVVCSFYQRKEHPNRSNFLVPCMGVLGHRLLLHMYDSQNDVLLKLSPLALRSGDPNCLDMTAVICLWMALNYQNLGTGLPNPNDIQKANFFEISKPKLNVYMNNIRFGDVGSVKRELEDDDTAPQIEVIISSQNLKKMKAQYAKLD